MFSPIPHSLHSYRSFFPLGLALATLGCSEASGPEACADGSAIPLEAGSCLVFEDGGQLDAHRTSIERIIGETLSSVRALMPLDEVSIRVVTDGSSVIPELGMGGRAFGIDEIRLSFDPESPNLAPALPTELFPLLAHEMHHTMRIRTVGYGSDLLGAMISEGLADQFSVEIAGVDPPPWSTALTAVELAEWSERAREHWFDSPYDHDGWFFGTDPDIPRWTGYTIGFELTGAFLGENPTRRPSRLFDEPASSFVP